MKEHHDCHHLLSSLSEFADNTLDEELCAEIERHIAECEDCRIVVDTLKKTIYLYHETVEPPSLPTEIRTRLFRRLDLEDFLEKPATEGEPE
jgi:predicted anti-sigma-YlaC factor YlaD